MFNRLSKVVYRRSLWVLGAAAVFIAVAAVYGTGVFRSLTSGGFDNPDLESYKATVLMQEKMPSTQASMVVLFEGKNSQKADTPEFRGEVTKTLDRIKNDPSVDNVASYYTTGSPAMLSKDHTQTFALIGLKGSNAEQSAHVAELRSKLRSDLLSIKLGGVAAVNDEITSRVASDLSRAEAISFSLLAVLLVVVFRSLVAAALPLLLGGVAVLGAFLATRLLTTVTPISEYAINVIILLGLGLAVDYSLFMVSRFREELHNTRGDVPAALEKTMETAGRTIFFSGITVILSLLGLLIFPLNFLQSMGLGGAAAVVVAMVAALTVLPAVMARLGTRVNALSFGSVAHQHRALKAGKTLRSERKSLWYRISRGVMRRPVAVFTAVVMGLILLGTPFLHARFGAPDSRSLPVGSEAREVAESLTNFDTQQSPIQVVFQSNGDILKPATVGALYDYAKKLESIPGVTKVESIVSGGDQPMTKAAYQSVYAATGSPAYQIAKSRTGNNTALLTISYKDDPLSAETQTLVKQIREVAVPANASV
ncbi:MAG TPA: MMPL family transporter, partial [Candidatus Polarisedimenticolaceae bacterium]|nr:MMPL family transporter [Candidatus Polarisedimenticolaceae bacterium]